MKKILLSLALLSCLAQAAGDPTIPFAFHRRLELTVCDAKKRCETQVIQPDNTELKLELERFHAKGGGWDAWDRLRHEENGIVFKTEIHVIQHLKPGRFQYYLYGMIRSGKREGRLLRWHLENRMLQERVLEDKPVAFPGGTMQARLVIGP